MTKGKDIFWAMLTAGLPIVFTTAVPFLERLIEQSVARTYEIRLAMLSTAVSGILLGLLLAVAAVYLLKQMENQNRILFAGLQLGWIYCLYCVLRVPLMMIGLESSFGWRILAYGSTRQYLFFGFYSVLIGVYLKKHKET